MIQSNRDKIQALQTELFQDYFEIQMTMSFPDWKTEVQNVATAKQNSSYSTYKEMYDMFNARGANQLTVKDFDVTALAALMRFDFSFQCCFDYQIRRNLGHIVLDRNGFSHISNYNDIQSIISLEKTAVANIKQFVQYLATISWAYPQKAAFFRKYLGTGHGDGLIAEIEGSVASESSNEAEFRANLLQYLQNLQIVREEHKSSYVALSYNLEGHKDNKKYLEELIDENIVNSSKGFRLVAEGGYGKSWTLMELAGRFAEKYLNSANKEDEFIPVIIELGKLYRECSSVKQKLAQLLFNGDAEKVNGFYKAKKIILFIDAIDESKADIQQEVSRELASLKDLYANLIFVCASRKSCIDKYPITIPCYAIKELDDLQITEYIQKAMAEAKVEDSELVTKAIEDWTGEKRKEFLYNNRTPFYIACYMELLVATGDNDFVDTTQLIEKFLNSIIERELRKTGFNSDKATFINFLKELCRLLDSVNEEGEKQLALPENEVIRELTNRIIIDEGQASIKAVGKKLIEIQILARDEEELLLSFAHQNYKEYINRKYPAKRYRSW